jgi:hypothetical protein
VLSLQDRFERGFIAGVIGGIIMNIWSFISGYLQFTHLRMVDWAGIMFFGHTPPFTLLENIVALGLQLGFSGFLGVVFAFLIPMIASQNLYFKGLVFSAAVWFFIYGVTGLFRVPGTVPASVGTVVSNLIAAFLFGLGSAFYLKQFSSTPALRRPNLTAVPAMKPVKKNDDADNPDKQ